MGEFLIDFIGEVIIDLIIWPILKFLVIGPGSLICSIVSFFSKSPKYIGYFYNQKKALSFAATAALVLLVFIMV